MNQNIFIRYNKKPINNDTRTTMKNINEIKDMKDIKVHFKIDYDQLDEEEKIYNKILFMCMSFSDSEIDCYPILPIYFEKLNLDESEFRDLFITALANKNFVLADIFYDKGVDINHKDIINAFKELCSYNQLSIIQYLIDKDFQITTKVMTEIISNFEIGFIPGFSKMDTVNYVEKVWFQNRIKKIIRLKKRIAVVQTDNIITTK